MFTKKVIGRYSNSFLSTTAKKNLVLFSPLYAKQENNGQQYTLIKIPTTKPKMYNKGKLCKFPNISTPTRT